MKLKKQIALIIAMLLLPLAASADDSGSCGDNVTYTYVEATNTLTISGTGAMWDYSNNYYGRRTPWNSYGSSIYTVIIEDGVSSIGDCAFYECWGLTSITIPNSVTSIGGAAFRGCGDLTSVTIPNSVTSIGDWAFYSCVGLTSITIPNSVTSIGSYAFGYCSRLTSITIPNSVTRIGEKAFNDTKLFNNEPYGLLYLDNWLVGYKGTKPVGDIVIKEGTRGIADKFFYDNKDLTSVTIPNSVLFIGSAVFRCCDGLTSVTIPNSVMSMGEETFYKCTGLTSVTIGNSVTSIGDKAFYGCSGLSSVAIPNSVTSIGYEAFSDCTGLTSVSIGNSVTSIEWGAFSGCRGLTSVTIPNSVTSIGSYAFSSCSGLTSVNIPNSVTSIGSKPFSLTGWYNNQPNGLLYLDNWLLGYKGSTPIGEIVIKEGTKGIAGGAFYGCGDLTSVTIPHSLIYIGSNAINCCSGLTSIKIENGNTVYDSRDNCNALIETATNKLITGCQNTVIPNSVTCIAENAFERCSGLTTVTIPSSVTSIGSGAFYNCSSLTQVLSMIKKPFAIKSVFLSNLTTNATLYVPKGTKKKYQVTEGWKDFANIVEMDGPAAIEGDLNGDNEVDVTDVVELIDMVLAGIYDAAGDINGDNEVDVTDVVELIDMVLSGE